MTAQRNRGDRISGNTKLQGRWGEAQAARYLTGLGYKIVAAGYRTRFGEIDLIAENGKYLAFVEVKMRKSDKFAAGREYVDRRKQARLIATAQLWLAENPSPLQPRFDVAEIYAPAGMATKAGDLHIEYIENAFEVTH